MAKSAVCHSERLRKRGRRGRRASRQVRRKRWKGQRRGGEILEMQELPSGRRGEPSERAGSDEYRQRSGTAMEACRSSWSDGHSTLANLVTQWNVARRFFAGGRCA